MENLGYAVDKSHHVHVQDSDGRTIQGFEKSARGIREGTSGLKLERWKILSAAFDVHQFAKEIFHNANSVNPDHR